MRESATQYISILVCMETADSLEIFVTKLTTLMN
jgi:hypothetical protein